MSLRHRAPELKRPFLLKAANIVTPLAFVGATLVIYWSKWKVVSFIIPIIILSLILYFIFAYREASYSKEKVRLHLKSGWWLIIYYLFLLAMSYVGSYGPGTRADHLIHAPWDTLVAGVLSLIFYYWGVHSALDDPEIKMDDVESTH
ncbi:hypothetical protein SAMN05428981_101343 [Bacillus sp. OV194]|nr:hypothetical protein SAMN05428981_101343 [Bacillus sp. OV194]